MTSTVIPASRENDEPISTEAIRAGPAICAALQKKGTTAQRFLQEAKLERLLENYQPSKLKQLKPNDPIWNKTFTKFETVDLVYPTPTGCHKEVATGLMTSIIMQNLDFFSTLNTEYRRMAVDAIVGHFETIGSRFLEAPPRHQVQQKRTYRLMSVPSIRTKVLYLFRINAFRARNKQRVLEDSTNNYNKKPRKTNSQRPKSQTKSLASRENLPRPPSKEVIFEETTHPTSAISSNKSVCSETESFKENQRHQKRPASESIEIAKKSVGIESGKKNFAKQTPSFYQGPLMNYIISCRVKMRTFVCKAQLEHLMQQNTKCVLRRHDFRDEYFHTTDTNFRNVDVVFPVRDEKCPHLGNALLKYIAHQNMKFFISLETEEEMSRAMESIVAHFESIESRFLEEVSDSGHSERRVRSYRPIDYPALERKLTALFQNGGRCDPGENTREPTRKRPSSLDYYGSSPPQKKSRQSGGGSFQPSFSLNAREQLDQSLEVYLAAEKASIERFVRNADLRQLSESFNSSGSRGIPNKAWGTTIHSIRPLDVLANNHQPQLGVSTLRSLPSSTLWFATSSTLTMSFSECFATRSAQHECRAICSNSCPRPYRLTLCARLVF